MSIASYADLQTAVGNWLNRGDLTSIIPDLIMLGEKRINRDIKTPDMEEAFSGTIASGAVAVPADFLGWKFVYIDAARVATLEPKPIEWIYKEYPNRSSDGMPFFIGRNGANFEFGPYPDSGYTVKGTYYKRLASVSSSWNALATTHPDLYLFAALCEATPYIKDDPRVQLWESKYSSVAAAINGQAKEQELGFGALRMSPR